MSIAALSPLVLPSLSNLYGWWAYTSMTAPSAAISRMKRSGAIDGSLAVGPPPTGFVTPPATFTLTPRLFAPALTPL